MPETGKIVRRIRQGDIREFEKLFRSSYVSLVKYAMTLLKDKDSAEEIVQSLFVSIWQDREKLAIKSSLTGYLFRSVHNRCLHHISHMKVMERHTRENLAENSGRFAEADEEIRYRELQERIAGVLERLPERCSRIFCLNRFEGLKYAEIAEKMSISVKTVEACISRALKEFRKSLG